MIVFWEDEIDKKYGIGKYSTKPAAAQTAELAWWADWNLPDEWRNNNMDYLQGAYQRAIRQGIVLG